MGLVYQARTESGRAVAIKILRRELVDVENFTTRFAGEIDISSRLSHDNLIRVIESGVLGDGRPFLVMELIHGRTLAEVLVEEGRIEWRRALLLVRQVLLALAELHDLDVVHRDIKPENIFVLQTELGEKVKLFDLGLAKVVSRRAGHRQELTQPGFAIGTPSYLAPERVGGESRDPRSDLYAVAIVLYELIAGSPPFVDDGPEAILRSHMSESVPRFSVVAPDLYVPPEVEALVRRALNKSPEDRFSDARDFAGHIEPLLLADIEKTVATGAAPRRMTWAQRIRQSPRQLAAIVGVTGMALLAAVAVAASGGGEPPRGAAVAEQDPFADEPARSDPRLDAVIAASESAWAETADAELSWIDAPSVAGGRCRRAAVVELDVRVCVYDDDEAASRGEAAGLETIDEGTAVAVAAGDALLLIADPAAVDPEGRQIQALIEGFAARAALVDAADRR